jgi:hypothetical protein
MGSEHQCREINSVGAMLSVMASARHDPFARMLNVDVVGVAVAVLLPWSTSGVAIGMVVWLVALAATLELRPFLRSLRRPISSLPLALVAFATIGTLAERQGPSGAAADGGCGQLHSQHGIRHRLAHRAGYGADHAGRIRYGASEMANQRGRRLHRVV